jgi:hypothetical protein
MVAMIPVFCGMHLERREREVSAGGGESLAEFSGDMSYKHTEYDLFLPYG